MRFLILLPLLCGAESKYLARDLDKVAAEYLVVAPPAFADGLDVLADHRAKSYRVAIVRTDDVAEKFGPGPEGIAALVRKASPRFLLLAGDSDAVPTFVRKGEYVSDRFMSDKDLATDHLYGPATGRFPADTTAELDAMIAKTVEYETSLPGGSWQKKIAFVAGEGGFGPVVDDILERQFTAIVSGRVPPAYDVELAYAKFTSKYSFYPPKFHANALRMLNEGALFYVYAGHGFRTGFDDLRYKDRIYPIFGAQDVKDVAVKAGLPIMVVIACSTAEFDWNGGDAIGESLLKRPRGPVAFIGGSRVTQPYGNGLFSHALTDQMLHKEGLTLGEALWKAKAALLAKDDSALRLQADALASVVQGPASLEPMRKDVVLHYNLLGDPALRIRRPANSVTLVPRGHPGPGRTFAVTGAAPDGPVEVTFECARDAFCRPVELVGDDVEEAVGRRYANANDKMIRRTAAVAKDGEFEVEVELPEDLPPGKYVLKAWASGSFGAQVLELTLPGK